MKNILITGGAGFIGSNLAIKLLTRGYNVTILDNLSEQIHGKDPKTTSPLYNNIKNSGAAFVKGSVTDRKTLEQVIEHQDCIVHLAAETGTGQSMYEIERYCQTNIMGTALLADVLTNKKHNVEKVVVASSRAIYGEGKYFCKHCGDVYPSAREDKAMHEGDFECKCPVCSSDVELVATDENSLIHPTSVYGINKQNQEQMIMLLGNTLGISSTALRYQNVYGPTQSLSNPYTGILSVFSTQIRNEHPLNIFEDGNESRDFVFIDDVTDATILAIEKKQSTGEIFNIGTGISTSVNDVAKELIANYGINVPMKISGNYRLGDIRHNFADISKADKLLDYKPKISFAEGIKRFTSWVKTQDVTEDKYQSSIDEMKSKGLYK
ncbi:MAG: NAD-dependent epimerase/dehydratase family protein [Bacteroidales bacterium]|jgi:dTDP-L-rhamnose 4-epimerase|nr:NAD-dependent epimerase/dehydratase family protein [Bacteroidales bacterium]